MRIVLLALMCLLSSAACSPESDDVLGARSSPAATDSAPGAPAPSKPPPRVVGPWTLAFATESSARPGLDIYVAKVPSGKPRLLAGVVERNDFSPSISPDGRWVAYRLNPLRGDESDIHVVSTRGGKPMNLTRSPGIADWSPAWTPSGEQIAYASNVDGDLEIWVMEADGSGKRQLTDDPALDEYPTWSPDGSRIAFNSTRASGQYDVWVMDIEEGASVNLTDHPATDEWPAWSPDGEWIAFMSDRDGSEDVFVVRPDGTDLRNLTTGTDLQESHPAWLPDGTLTFSRHGESGPVTVWAASVKDGSETQIDTPAEPVFVYSWGPRGR